MKCLLKGLLACGLLLSWAGVSSAANPTTTSKVSVPRTFKVKQMCGTEVRNLKGEKIGTINDFVMNIDTGKINYAALATGGTLGIGEKLFAVPFNELKLSFNGDTMFFVVNVSKEKLKNSKGFDKDHWPPTAQPDFAEQVNHNAAAPKSTPR